MSKTNNNNKIIEPENLEDYLVIGFCGQVSAGKSSLINALCGSLNAMSTSILRETIQPERITLKTCIKPLENIEKIEEQTYKIKLQNEQKRDNNTVKADSNIQDRGNIHSYFGRNVIIIDFPGINDTYDVNEQFYKVLIDHLKKLHILVYVTSAESAFIQLSETTLYKKIKDQVDNLYNEGFPINLINIVNKFDNPYDVDLNKVFQKLEKMNIGKCYPLSSHALLLHNLKKAKIKRTIPKHLRSEFAKILRNSQVATTRDFIIQINDNKEIEFEKLEFSGFMDEDSRYKLEYDTKNIGDWYNFIDFIKNYNIKEEINRCKESYIDKHLNKSDFTAYFNNILTAFEGLYKNLKTIYKIPDIFVKIYEKFGKSTQYLDFFNVLSKKEQKETLEKCLTVNNIIDNNVSLLLILYFGDLLDNNYKFLQVILKTEKFWQPNYKLVWRDNVIDTPYAKGGYKCNLFISGLIHKNKYLEPLVEIAITSYADLVKERITKSKDFNKILGKYPEININFSIRMNDPFSFKYGSDLINDSTIPTDLMQTKLLHRLFN